MFGLQSFSNVLVVASHPDDEVLGCGGLLAKLSANGVVAKVVYLTAGEASRDGYSPVNEDRRKRSALKASQILGYECIEFFNFPDNELDAVSLLQVTKALEGVFASVRPDAVFTHYAHDLNIDHQIAFKATITACRPWVFESVKGLFSFEVPSSTDLLSSFDSFKPNVYVDISDVLELKVNAMKAYGEEMRDFPHPRSEKSLISLAEFRGTQSNLFAAEGFLCNRLYF